MARLSSPIERLADHYDVVVVGSGYGAAIAASRFARCGRTVAVLERGREFQPSEYPDTEPGMLRETQADLPAGHVGDPAGLYRFNINDDINAFVGCGLGGGSLVNANVSIRPEPRVFADPRWPQELRADLAGGLERGYARASEMLRPTPYPADAPTLPKLTALEASARGIGGTFSRVPINVNFTVDGPNHVGVEQHPCTFCGDCCSGCNYGAKNTLITNYLPDAKSHGAVLFTAVDVRSVERRDGRWLVRYQLLDVGRDRFGGPELAVGADVVVLGGGSLGSTEVLLRSRARGLALSDQLGERFITNGDMFGFGYDTAHVIGGVGWGRRRPGELPAVGPCITGAIDLREQPVLEDGILIEDGSPPGAIAGFLPGGLAAAAELVGRSTEPGLLARLAARLAAAPAVVDGPYRGPIARTQTFLVMAHDDGCGRLLLEGDRLRIRWPGLGDEPVFSRVDQTLDAATKPLDGTYVKNPLWHEALVNNLTTTHPLGGCPMGDDAAHGVVNHKGQVFAGASGEQVHDGLYVLDGSTIPRPLGANPLLTISAIAERAVALAAADRGWSLGYDLPAVPPDPVPPTPPEPIAIEFTESMVGFVGAAPAGDYAGGAHAGRTANQRFSFTLTIVSRDVDALLADPAHQAGLIGTVRARYLSPDPLTATDGHFQLFSADPADPLAREMRYRMLLTAVSGDHYFLEGFKRIRNDPGPDLWADTTTLFTTVHRGRSADDPVLATGILRIAPQDFLRQLTTMKVRGAGSMARRLAAEERFAGFFLGTLAHTYGKLFR